MVDFEKYKYISLETDALSNDNVINFYLKTDLLSTESLELPKEELCLNIGIREIIRMKMLYILNVAERVNNFSYASMIAAKN